MRLLTTLLLLLPFAAFATVSLESQPYKVVMTAQEDGSMAEEWVEADKIAPGDKVGYRITYVNTGSEPVSGVTIKNPVPENTVYIMNSANGAGTAITLSVDGSQFAPVSELNVLENGSVRPAGAKDIESIRWIVDAPLAPSATGFVEFQVRVK
ncbi:hypothetical protein [Thalassolituus sp.]|uniref:hypothetical protein n=1 Tax=Thalassolituus sp. TaxID=2030822 RepID=UPI0035112FAC